MRRREGEERSGTSVGTREGEYRVFRVQKEDMSRDVNTQFKPTLLERK